MDKLQLKQNIRSHLEFLYLEKEQLEFLSQTHKDNIKSVNNKIKKLNNQLKSLEDTNLVINIKDWLPKDQYEQYCPSIDMLFEEGMEFSDWLDWFYEELPFIKDKHLMFTGSTTNKEYSFLEITGKVYVDKYRQIIYVDSSEPINISINSLNLFKLLSVQGNQYDI